MYNWKTLYRQAFRCKLGELGDDIEIHDCQNKKGFILGHNVKSFTVFHFYEALPFLFLSMLWRFKVPLNIALLLSLYLLLCVRRPSASAIVLYSDDHPVTCSPLLYFLSCPGSILGKYSYLFCKSRLLFLF